MSQLVSSLENPRGLTGWQLAKALFRGDWVPGNAWRRTYYRSKFMFRYMLTYSLSAPWLDYLARSPRLADMLQSQPGLPCKLHRPYLAANISHQQKLAALMFHYDYIQTHLPRPLLNGLFAPGGITLATLAAKNGARFHLRLDSLDNLNREGEATVLLTNERDVVLAEMTFALTPEQEATLFIGGLQGANREVPHGEIHLATKLCHGLFPKRLVLEAVRLLAINLGVKQILAVSNHTHMYHEWRYCYKKKHFMHADYDNFWLSMHGEFLPQGFFSLPLRMERKPLESLPSKKRAEYRRRYELLDQMNGQINAFFPQTERT